MSLYADSHNPDREILRIRIKLQTRAYEAAGWKIKQIPIGATAYRERSMKQLSKDLYEAFQQRRSGV